MADIIKLPKLYRRPTRPPDNRVERGPSEPEDTLFAFPLSPAQEYIWHACRMDPVDPAYNCPFRWSVTGRLNVPVLAKVFTEIARRHECLRTRFSQIGVKPVQLVAAAADQHIDVIDLRSLLDTERDPQMERICVEEAKRRFDIEKGPLVRVKLVHVRDEHYVLLLTLHHLVFDGWSLRLIMQEMQQLYAAFLEGHPSPLPQPMLQFADYVIWQLERATSDSVVPQLDYWKSKLAGYRRLEIAADSREGATDPRPSSIVDVVLPKEVTDRLRLLSNDLGGTMFTTALAACMALLHRVTGKHDIAIGSPVACRDQAGAEALIGPLVNHLVFRTEVVDDPQFRTFATLVRDTVWEAMANQDVPFAHVVRAIQSDGKPAPKPLYVINFVCQRAFGEGSQFAVPGIKVSAMPSKSPGALYDLNFFMVERVDLWRLSLEYNTTLYSESRAQTLLDNLRELLEGIAADSNLSLSKFPLSNQNSTVQLLANEHATISTQCAPIGDMDTYAMPMSTAQQRFWLLAKLESNGAALNLPACVRVSGPLSLAILRQSLQVIVDRHEILRTAFAEMDGSLIQLISKAHELSLIVTDLEAVPSEERDEKLQTMIKEEAMRPFDLRRTSALRAHLYRRSTDDHVLLLTLHHIVADGWSHTILQNELWTAYQALTENKHLALPALAIQYGDFAIWQQQFLQSDEASLHLTHWTAHLASLSVLDFPMTHSARNQLASHDVIETSPLSEHLMRAIKELSRSEGTTSFTLLWTCFAILLSRYAKQGDVLIGSPVANRGTEVDPLIGPFAGPTALRLDLSGNPTFVELLQRASTVTMDALTHAALPFEILVQKLKVKSTSGRNPLFQFFFAYQTAFLQPRTLSQVTVTPLPTVSLGTTFELQLTVVDRHAGTVAKLEYNPSWFDALTIQQALRYYVALLHTFVSDPQRRISDLPPPPEVDTKSPARPVIEFTQDYRAPRNNDEAMLTEIWGKLLNISQIGMRDDFFDLGGNSLLAAQLIVEVEKETGVRLELSALLTTRTIERLAAQVSKIRGSSQACLVPMPSAATTPVLFCIPGIEGHAFNFRDLAPMVAEKLPVRLLHQEVAPNALKELKVESQAELYLRDIRRIQQQGPYRLCGYSFGSLVAFELASRLKCEGEDIDALILLDAVNPAYYRNLPFTQFVRFWGTCTIDRVGKCIRRISQASIADLADGIRHRLASKIWYLWSIIHQETGRLANRSVSAAARRNMKLVDVVDPIYLPNMFIGRMLLIRAKDRPPEYRHEPTLGWGDVVSGQIDIRYVEGDHLSMLAKPSVRKVAEAITDYLNNDRLKRLPN